MTMSFLPHCKNQYHVQAVDIPGATNIVPRGLMTATLVTDMQCAGAVGTVPWGVLLSLPQHPGEGMHLLPDGARYLSGALIRMGSNTTGDPVGINHTIIKVFRTWKILYPDDAVRVGNDIAAIVKGQGG